MESFEFEDDWSAIIRHYAKASEEAGVLHPEILRLIRDRKWFKMYIPETCGGLRIRFPEIVRVLERLALADGSTGWTVTLCSGASWFTGFLSRALAEALGRHPDLCIGGSGAATGTALRTKGGYIVNGYWQHASGALHATHFTANCVVKNEDGSPATEGAAESVRSFLFTKDDVEVVPNWSLFGMRATGSHAFRVKDLFVREEATFLIDGEQRQETNAGSYPFLPLAEATLAANFSGMALHFFELLEARLFERGSIRKYAPTQADFVKKEAATQKETFLNGRARFFEAVDYSWDKLAEKNGPDEDIFAPVSRLSRKLAHTARRVTDALFPYAGFEIVRTDTELNRVWRDLHTASQHSLLTFEEV